MPSSRGSRSTSPRNGKAIASERSPLLGAGARSSEQDPLLGNEHGNEDGEESSRRSSRRRWPSIVALIVLCASCAVILAVGFFAPAVGEKYAKEAVTFEYRNASLVALESDGAAIRLVGDVRVDARKVRSTSVRNFGRLATWFVRRVSVGAAKVEVFVLDWKHGEELLGTAITPPMEVKIGNGEVTTVDVVVRARPGSTELIKALALAYLKSDLWRLRVEGRTEVDLHAGIIPLGIQSLREQLVFEGFPSGTPPTNITGLNMTEVALPEGGKAIQIAVNADVEYNSPLKFEVPKLDFEVYLPSCGDNKAQVATATTDSLQIEPKQHIQATINGLVKSLPKEFISKCPDSEYSPLDNFIGEYMHGKKTTVYVKGGKQTHSDVPTWLSEILQSVTVPVPFPGHEFGDLIKSFSLSDVDFELPDPSAEPDSPEAAPKLTASIEALVAIPKELNFPVDVKHLRAFANITHKDKKFGELHVDKWVEAQSQLKKDGDLLVLSKIDRVPIFITDYDIFQTVVQKMLWGGGVKLGIEGTCDVEIDSGLGLVVVRDVPAAGTIDIDGMLWRKSHPNYHA